MKNKIILFLLAFVVIQNAKAGTRREPFLLIADEQYQTGIPNAGVWVTIEYVVDGHLRKPFIVFEGFDPGIYSSPNVKSGRRGIDDFLRDVNNDAPINQQLPLRDKLQGTSQEYDIVYVDWVNGTDFIQNNERAAEKVINWVNDNKELVNGEKVPNVIAGKSMGSLIARYALKRMEDRFSTTGKRHNTRVYISLDGGQQGSNMPEGLQYFNNHFRDMYILTGPTAIALELLPPIRKVGSPLAKFLINETPASRQLTINHVNPINGIDNSMHNSFVSELQTLGYPSGDGITTLVRIAVSNGSECGKQQDIGNGGNILTWKGKAYPNMWVEMTGLGSGIAVTAGAVSTFAAIPMSTLGSLPGRNQFNVDFEINGKASGQSNQVYKGQISYTKKIFGLINVSCTLANRTKNESASTLAYDYYPGGNQTLEEELKLPDDASGFWFTNNIQYSIKPYCHVPVPSALDLGGGSVTLTETDYLNAYTGANPPAGTNASTFPAFITAFNGKPDNEPHTQIERRNSDWIADWLNNNQVLPENCSFSCSPIMNGPATFCGVSSAYSIQGLPSAASVNWSVSPTGIANVSCSSCASPTLTQVGNGSITVTAAVTSACGSFSIPRSISVGVSTDNLDIIRYQYSPNCVPSGWPAQFVVSNNGDTTYPLEVENVSGATLYNAPNYSSPVSTATTPMFGIAGSGSQVQLRVRVQDASCGWSSWKYIWLPVCSSQFMLSPNPAGESLTVSALAANETSGKTSSTTASIRQIEITSKNGIVLKRLQYGSASSRQQVWVSDLKPGFYWLNVYDGSHWQALPFMKQ